MSAYVLPNIILFVAIIAFVAVVARHLPEGKRQVSTERKGQPKGGSGRWLFLLHGYARTVWRFVLEAKGLYDPAGSRFRMKQLLLANQRKTRARASAQPRQASGGGHRAAGSAVDVGESPAPPPPVPVVAQGSVRRTRTEPPAPVVQTVPAVAPGALDSSMMLAKQYLDNKQYFEARKLLESLGTQAQTSSAFWARLGYAQYHLASFSEAVRCYEKSLAIDDNQPNRYYNLALAYEAAGNRLSALRNLEKAISRDPENPKYRQTKLALSA